MSINLHPHQLKALEKLSNGRILFGGTGSGKTHVAVAYCEQKEAPRDVYVITTARKRDSKDWEKTFALIGVGSTPGATMAGVLTVDSWNNIHKYKDVQGAFFILDEQRLVGSGEWAKNFLRIAKNNHWILLSATPGDNWLDYIPVFIANGFYKNRTEFKRDHVVYAPYTNFPKVDRYLNTGKLLRLRNQLLVEMPFLRHTTRHIEEVEVEFDAPLFRKVMIDRWNPWEDRPILDVAELFRAMRRVVNSDTSRLEAVKKLLSVHPKLIVFYNFNYELESLRNLSGLEIPSPNVTPKTLSEELQELNGKWQTPKPVSTRSSLSTLTRSSASTGSVSAARNLSSPTTSTLSESTSSILNTTSGSTLLADDRHEKNTQNPKQLWKLSDHISTSLDVAEWNGHKHQPVPETDRWLYLVQFAAGAEAWNCITTDAMCMYSLPYSYKFWHQAHGRIDRLDTPHSVLRYYYLKSKSFIDRSIAASLDNKRDFNESEFVTSRARVNETG